MRCEHCDIAMGAINKTLCASCRTLRQRGEMSGFIAGIAITLVTCGATALLIWLRF